jgi:endonuclease YncB( thermonuclease family)
MIYFTVARTAAFALVLHVIAATANAQSTEPKCGSARVVDGDGLVIGDTTFRLFGIDAPETYQRCFDDKCEAYTCGIVARDRLSEHIAGRPVCCIPNGKDRRGRTLATCSVDGEELNAWQVREGLALAYTRFSRNYVDQQRAAEDAGRGMWRGAFIAPSEQRRCGKLIPVLGARKAVCPDPSCLPEDAPPGCTIKGNVSRNGRIYFVQGHPQYSSVKINGLPKRWFCSEEEARAEGWRPAAR